MKIKDILEKVSPSFSFEFFPPKDSEGFEQLYKTISQLKACNPTYVSVTYGAGGSTRSKTIDLVGRIKNDIGMESMAHLTCVGNSQEELRSVLDTLQEIGIQNILALRGDPPQGQETFVRPENGFAYANELVGFIRKNYDFCIGVAGYPEGHVECSDKDVDLDNLKRKVDAGADFIVTQLFFDNRYYFDFIERTRAIGIGMPIIPGIMPILNARQTQRFTKMCGSTIPENLMKELELAQGEADRVRQIGIEYATRQCEKLLQEGAPGIHFYTLNRSNATLKILENLTNLSG
jgi:methylenetetrahydrofolate reductase (NADPH)